MSERDEVDPERLRQAERLRELERLRGLDRKRASFAVSGAAFTAGGAGAAGVAIAGLSGAIPAWMAEIGCVTAGVGLLVAGGAAAAPLVDVAPAGSPGGETGIAAAMVGGVAAIALGILGLVGVAPWPLTSIAVIVLGGALVLASALPVHAAVGSTSLRLARALTIGVQALAGVGVITLGVVALVGVEPLWLDLVGVLVAGAAALLAGCMTLAASTRSRLAAA